MSLRKLPVRLAVLPLLVILFLLTPLFPAAAETEEEPPNTDISVIPSNANALILMDVGAQSPRGVPGDVVTVVLPVAVNREYLPTERYILRNITVEPKIPTDASVSNWPFDLTEASYLRHLEDMSYNSTADIYYDFRISQFATKGVYPVNFRVTATVWREDDVNGTSITEDVVFPLCVYVTVLDDGSRSGETTTFAPLQVAAINQSGSVSVPSAKPSWAVTMKVPVVNKGGKLEKVTVEPVVTTSLDTFPFVASSANMGLYFDTWEKDEIKELEWSFAVSRYATDGNKVVTFQATYYENGQSAKCTFTSQISIFDGYEKPVQEAKVLGTAMSVMVSSYELLTDGRLAEAMTAGEDAVLRVTLVNNGEKGTAYKTVVSLNFSGTKDLGLALGSTNAAYIAAIPPGETATVDFRITAASAAEVGLATLGLALNYETADYVSGSAVQTIMLPMRQPMELSISDPVVYGTPVLGEELSVSLDLVNLSRAKALNLRIRTEGGVSIAESWYGGDILPGGSRTADLLLRCERSGKVQGRLLFLYEDAAGESYTQTLELPLTVAEAREPTPVQPSAAPEAPTERAPETLDSMMGNWWFWALAGLGVLVLALLLALILRGKRAPMD